MRRKVARKIKDENWGKKKMSYVVKLHLKNKKVCKMKYKIKMENKVTVCAAAHVATAAEKSLALAKSLN